MDSNIYENDSDVPWRKFDYGDNEKRKEMIGDYAQNISTARWKGNDIDRGVGMAVRSKGDFHTKGWFDRRREAEGVSLKTYLEYLSRH